MEKKLLEVGPRQNKPVKHHKIFQCFTLMAEHSVMHPLPLQRGGHLPAHGRKTSKAKTDKEMRMRVQQIMKRDSCSATAAETSAVLESTYPEKERRRRKS